MDTNENDYMTNFHNFNQSTSPQSKRNTKNLSLKLGPSHNNNNNNDDFHSQGPIPFPSVKSHTTTNSPITSSSFPNSNPPPPATRLFRHPSLSLSKNTPPESNSTLRRRTTLSLSIPSDPDSSSKTSSKLSSNSIPSFSSSSPITSSPIIPFTPLEFLPTLPSSKRSNSTTSSNKTLNPNESSNILRTQTLIQNMSMIDISSEGDTNKINAYPNGPVCVLEPNVFLYSEPTAEQIQKFDLVINVARELIPPIPGTNFTKDKIQSVKIRDDKTDYYFVPWTHTSKLCTDLPYLTDIIINSLSKNEKILIHCQCGVSRSASLIVALIMKIKHMNLNDAYNFLKEKAPDISPNMSLIFQLMEWGEIIGVSNNNSTSSLCESLQSSNNNEMQIQSDPLMTYQ